MPLLDPESAVEALSSGAPANPPAPVVIESSSTNIEAIAVSDELATLFTSSKTLLNSVLTDPEVPANQRAQVLNSVSSILEKITKMRTDLYNAERIRAIEQALIKTMREQPKDIQAAFFEAYERNLA